VDETEATGWALTGGALSAGVLFTRINVDTFPAVANVAATELEHALQVRLHLCRHHQPSASSSAASILLRTSYGFIL
jgi:hypothetical protein